MKKEWIFPQLLSDGEVERMAEELNVPAIIAEILVLRDIRTGDEAKQFFKPKMSDLYDPFLLKNMQTAVDRIQEALIQKENILIYGDYDVDGITACSLLYLFFKELTDRVFYFIPERLKEGYGFSLKGIEEAKKKDVTLIITVDCGITAIDEIQRAQAIGIDVIVTDHHQPGSELPDAFAIINPLQINCPYPFKGLAGVGVAFKLIHALDLTICRDITHLYTFTDLVAIGSSADVVPLVDENRILVKAGLERINGRHNIGLNALLSVASLNNSFIGTGQILFGIAPRINAVGRLGSADRAVRLFAVSDMSQAYEIAQVLEQENRQRKSIEEETFDEALSIAKQEFKADTNEPLVLFKEGWHPGVIGIIASRIVDQFFRPVVMIAVDDGIGKGSIRSVPDFDVYSALEKCSEYLKEFGGHKYAAGLTIETGQLDGFKSAFQKNVSESITDDALIPKLKIDGQISLDQINDRFFEILQFFAPFGPQNTRPVFVAEGVEAIGTPVVVGKNHLKLNVRQNGTVMPVIGFKMGDYIDKIEIGVPNLELAFVIDENVWRGTTTLQLQLKDLRIHLL